MTRPLPAWSTGRRSSSISATTTRSSGSIRSRTRSRTLLEWEDDYPWGITFNEDYTALYISVIQGFDGYIEGPSRIYKLKLDDAGYADGDPEVFVEFTGETSWTEGLAVDVCGNVYASLGTKIMRVSKDGKTIDRDLGGRQQVGWARDLGARVRSQG